MEITPQLTWEIGTAYDFFTSLDVIHNPARYGLRGSWAAGVRSRLPAEQREFLQNVVENHNFWAIPWLANQSGAKDSASVLKKMSAIPAEDRLQAFAVCYMDSSMQELLNNVAEQGSWKPEDKILLRDLLKTLYKEETGKSKRIPDDDLIATLDIWANRTEFGEKIVKALNVYYDVFFR